MQAVQCNFVKGLFIPSMCPFNVDASLKKLNTDKNLPECMRYLLFKTLFSNKIKIASIDRLSYLIF